MKAENDYNPNYINFQIKTAVNSIKFDKVKNIVTKSDSNCDNIKTLTLNLLDVTKPYAIINSSCANDIEKCIEKWAEDSLNQKKMSWTTELIDFCIPNEDILSIYVFENCEFVVVIEDVTDNKVFEYTDFCFELAEKHETISNFMVIDEAESKGSHDLLQNYELIYKKG